MNTAPASVTSSAAAASASTASAATAGPSIPAAFAAHFAATETTEAGKPGPRPEVTMRFDRQLGRMRKVVVMVDPVTDDEILYAIVCADGGWQPVGQDYDALLGLRQIACDEVEVSLVEVSEPRSRMLPRLPDADAIQSGAVSQAEVQRLNMLRATRAKEVVAAVAAGESLTREWTEDGKFTERRQIGKHEARRRYMRRVDTVCPGTSTAKL